MLVTCIDLEFSVTGEHPLHISVEFDNKIIFSNYVNNADSIIKISRRFLNLSKDRTLTIYIDGKTNDMTIVDNNDNIIEDTCFNLHSISLNKVPLGEVFFQNAVYQHTHNSATGLVTSQPSDISGFNGCITWNFYSPAIKWLYDHELIDRPSILQQTKDRWPQIKKNIRRRILHVVGIDILVLFKIFYLPKYFFQLYKWKKLGGSVDGYEPILSDYSGTEAGQFNEGYYYQDIMVASHIHATRPQRHVTIGSNITGFVGHIATFMPIDVVDIRPLTAIAYPNIQFIQRDLGSPNFYNPDLMSDSVSCLSCIHHVGIGRYGDAVNPDGPFNALDNLQKIVKPGGMLYIGTSVGPKSRVIFNTYRVFTVNEILDHLPNFELIRFDYYVVVGNVIQQHVSTNDLANIPKHSYGIFVLQSKLTR
jgi:hypothetical protein